MDISLATTLLQSGKHDPKKVQGQLKLIDAALAAISSKNVYDLFGKLQSAIVKQSLSKGDAVLLCQALADLHGKMKETAGVKPIHASHQKTLSAYNNLIDKIYSPLDEAEQEDPRIAPADINSNSDSDSESDTDQPAETPKAVAEPKPPQPKKQPKAKKQVDDTVALLKKQVDELQAIVFEQNAAHSEQLDELLARNADSGQDGLLLTTLLKKIDAQQELLGALIQKVAFNKDDALQRILVHRCVAFSD